MLLVLTLFLFLEQNIFYKPACKYSVFPVVLAEFLQMISKQNL